MQSSEPYGWHPLGWFLQGSCNPELKCDSRYLCLLPCGFALLGHYPNKFHHIQCRTTFIRHYWVGKEGLCSAVHSFTIASNSFVKCTKCLGFHKWNRFCIFSSKVRTGKWKASPLSWFTLLLAIQICPQSIFIRIVKCLYLWHEMEILHNLHLTYIKVSLI